MADFEEFKRLNARKTAIVHLGVNRPTGNPQVSHFCLTPLAAPGEVWPAGKNGPMLFVCQFNLTAAPHVPEILCDVALLSFFIDIRRSTWGKENLDGWCLRTYAGLGGLAPLSRPSGAPKGEKPCECRWEVFDDYPKADDPELVTVDGVDPLENDLPHVHRTKVGGFPSIIRRELWWDSRAHPAQPKFCVQIDSEPKAALAWGDSGTLYLARGTADGFRDKWYLDWQC